MRKFKSAWPFLEPVNREDVPDYYDIVTDPIGWNYLNFINRYKKHWEEASIKPILK
jgi:hypothetical protein